MYFHVIGSNKGLCNRKFLWAAENRLLMDSNIYKPGEYDFKIETKPIPYDQS